ncbi:MAG: glutamate--cysteine ligase, partial [Burkholderiaceae bacterium]
SLQKALTDPYGPYTEIGIRDGDEYRQLCDTLLQIENEFYGLIRPKRPIKPGERPLHALNDRGVEYVEVRCLDLDPFSPVGLSEQTSRFIDVFLLYCMLTDSPNDTDESIAQNNANQLAVAERGRAPGLTLHHPDGKPALLVDMGQHLVEAMRPIAMALDSANATGDYSSALEHGQACLQDATLTPSARILSSMARDWGNSYSKFALNQSEQHRKYHLSHAPSEQQLAEHRATVEQSWQDQQSIEAADEIDFETYRQQYISQAFTVASS